MAWLTENDPEIESLCATTHRPAFEIADDRFWLITEEARLIHGLFC